MRLHLTDANGSGGVVEHAIHPTWGDPFVAEWLAFAESVTHRRQPRASAADFRHDLELFGAMVELMSADPAENAVSASGTRRLVQENAVSASGTRKLVPSDDVTE